MTSPIEKLREQLEVKRTPEQRAAMYDRHNRRCRELGLHRIDPESLKGQGCPYPGGFPA